MRKDVKQLIQFYERLGWIVSKTNGGHIRFKGPNGQVVFGSSTPSDWRSLANLKAQLNRAMRHSA